MMKVLPLQIEEAVARPARRVGHTRPASPLSILAAILIAEMVVLALLIVLIPYNRSRVLSILPRAVDHPVHDHTSHDHYNVLADDPAIGSSVPSTKAGAELSGIARKSRAFILLIPVFDCATCTRADLAGWDDSASARGVTVLYLTSASHRDAEEYRIDLELKGTFVFDPADELAKKLNAARRARPYLISPDGKIIWLSKDRTHRNPFNDPAFLNCLEGYVK
jgi:hypothetical protein